MKRVLLKVPEAGESLGYKDAKVREFVRRNLLDGVMVDGRLRITAESVEKFPSRILSEPPDTPG